MIGNELRIYLSELGLLDSDSVGYFHEENNWKISSETKKKLEIIEPDAFYYFNKQPIILFFDFTKEKNISREKEIHKQVWSFDQAPLVIFIRKDSQDYFNAFDFDKRTGKLTEILDKVIAKEQCQFWNLQSGKTLDWFYDKYKKTVVQKRVNQQLFDNIKNTILLLSESYKVDENHAKILVLRLIFIRYLIDRKIRLDSSFIAGEEHEIYTRRKSFSDLIASPKKLEKLFKYINKRFNGVLFKDFSFELTFNQSSILSKLFNPDGVSLTDTQNLFTDTEFQYEIFDFGIIPVELISGIYESILDKETKDATSAIYTPSFLVDYILTGTVDVYFNKHPKASECKIFDPAMGSGIFLVQSLRRMIEREQYLHPNQDKKTFANRIKQIAENNLFGIDINEEAINVACFSIYVALLDYQEPGDIDEYQFPDLKGKNFLKIHFFDTEKDHILNFIRNDKIDFILGNPPWKRNSSEEHLAWLKQTGYKNIVSNKQIAQSYLLRVKEFAQSTTQVTLIVTSKAIYNTNAADFRDYFLRNNRILEFFDLSTVRHIVFEHANSPALIIQFKCEEAYHHSQFDNIVNHISIKQNRFFNKYSKNIFIEKTDRMNICQRYYIENEWMFKVALYGGTLDYLFLRKMDYKKFSLSDSIGSLKIEKGDGIKRHTLKSISKLQSEPIPFDDIKRFPIIETKDIKPYYTSPNLKNIPSYKDLMVKSGRNINLYIGNKILFTANPKNGDKIVASYSEGTSVFREKTLGLSSPNERLLFHLLSIAWSDLYTYYIYLISSQWGVYYPQILQIEYMSFPFKEPKPVQKEKLIKLVDELLLPYKRHYTESPERSFPGEANKQVLEKINEVIYEIYDVKGYEKDLIDYVLNVSRYQFQESKQSLVSSFNEADHRNKEAVLRGYAEIYIQEFGEIYKNDYIQVEIYELNHFITMNFIFLNEKPKSKNQVTIIKDISDVNQLFSKLPSLSISKIASSSNNEQNLFIQKDIKGFEENSFFIIKPSEYKCWHRAIAWYDVAEFKEQIVESELDYLKGNNNVR